MLALSPLHAELHAKHLERQIRLNTPPRPQTAVVLDFPKPKPEPSDTVAAWVEMQRQMWSDPAVPAPIADLGTIPIAKIQETVCRHYGVTRVDMLSARRTWDIVRPRQVAMYLARVLTTRSMPEIGRRFGDRDHTTALHAFRKIERLILTDMELSATINALKVELL